MAMRSQTSQKLASNFQIFASARIVRQSPRISLLEADVVKLQKIKQQVKSKSSQAASDLKTERPDQSDPAVASSCQPDKKT